MKHDIIKTDDYLLVVDESEIKGWYYDAYINKVKHSGGAEYGESVITRNIIAHLPLNGSPILEGVDLLPPLEEKDEKSMFANEIENILEYDRGRWYGRIEGYNKAKEKYKYTEEDLLRLLCWADSDERNVQGQKFEDFIQSLSQPKIPIGFEFEAAKSKPIFNGEPKTLSNVVGFTQWTWEGTYIFN